MNKGEICVVVLAMLATLWAVSVVHAYLARTAPLGYEDEKGFHFGDPSFDK